MGQTEAQSERDPDPDAQPGVGNSQPIPVWVSGS